MANITVSISTVKLQFAIAYIEGYRHAIPKATDATIDKALTDLGYTMIEIYLIKSTPTTAIIETVFNPPIHHNVGKSRKRKSTPEVLTPTPTASADEPAHGWENDTDSALEDENFLGV